MVQITLVGEGLTYEKEVTLQQASQIINFLSATEERPVVENYPATGGTNPISLPTMIASSPQEAIQSMEARTNAQKIVALASYLSVRDETETFSVEEVRDLFQKAGEPLPGNLSRDMRDAVSQGWVAESTTRGKYYLTNSGRKAVNEGFAVVSSASGASRAGRKRAKRGVSTKPSEKVTSLTISANLDGFPDFHKLPTRSDKILWMLQWAEVNELKELSAPDIVYIAGELKEGITSKNFTSSNTANIKKGFISTTGSKFKILQRGIDRLQKLSGSVSSRG